MKYFYISPVEWGNWKNDEKQILLPEFYEKAQVLEFWETTKKELERTLEIDKCGCFIARRIIKLHAKTETDTEWEKISGITKLFWEKYRSGSNNSNDDDNGSNEDNNDGNDDNNEEEEGKE